MRENVEQIRQRQRPGRQRRTGDGVHWPQTIRSLQAPEQTWKGGAVVSAPPVQKAIGAHNAHQVGARNAQIKPPPRKRFCGIAAMPLAKGIISSPRNAGTAHRVGGHRCDAGARTIGLSEPPGADPGSLWSGRCCGHDDPDLGAKAAGEIRSTIRHRKPSRGGRHRRRQGRRNRGPGRLYADAHRQRHCDQPLAVQVAAL